MTSVKCIWWCSSRLTGHDRSDPPRTRQKRTLSQPHDTILECVCEHVSLGRGEKVSPSKPLLTCMVLQEKRVHFQNLMHRTRSHLLSSKAAILILSMLASVWALARTLTSPRVATCEMFHSTTRFFPWPSLPTPHSTPPEWEKLRGVV